MAAAAIARPPFRASRFHGPQGPQEGRPPRERLQILLLAPDVNRRYRAQYDTDFLP